VFRHAKSAVEGEQKKKRGGSYGKHGRSVAMQPWQCNGGGELLTCAFMAAHLLADINRASQVVVSLRATRQISGIPFHAARCTPSNSTRKTILLFLSSFSRAK